MPAASQVAPCSYWLKFLLPCFWFSAHFWLHCLCPTPPHTWAQLRAITLLLVASQHMDLCIFDPLALCGHSDQTRLSVLW